MSELLQLNFISCYWHSRENVLIVIVVQSKKQTTKRPFRNDSIRNENGNALRIFKRQ